MLISSVRVGEQFPDVLHHGRLLPPGSWIGQYHRRQYVSVAPGVWAVGSNREPLADTYHLSTPMNLFALPEGEEIPLPPETVTEFRWRMRDAALGAAERSGVRLPPVLRMAAQFGAPRPLFRPGGIVCSRTDLDALPDGTVFYTGHPEVSRSMTVYEKRADRFVPVLGPERGLRSGIPVTLHEVPGYTPVDLGQPASKATLAAAALRAWRIGKVFQQQNSWCSVFETTLTMLGITTETTKVDGEAVLGPGDEVDEVQAGGLPEGSLLWWHYRNGRSFSVYRRVDTARNRARTKRIFGFEDSTDNAHSRMVVVKTPDEPMAWWVSANVLSRMPNGVRFSVDGSAEQELTDEVRRDLRYGSVAILSWPEVV